MIPQESVLDLNEWSIKLGFFANIFVLGGLPYTKLLVNESKIDSGKKDEVLHHTHVVIPESFTRSSAYTSITYSDAVGVYGLPYGSIPRLILIWIITELMQSNNFHRSPDEPHYRRVFLGKSIRHLMRKIYMNEDASTTSRNRHTFLNQLFRLSTCVISVNSLEKNSHVQRHQILRFFSDTLNWSSIQHIVEGCYFEVSYEFAQYLRARGTIPLLRESVLKLRKSPLQIDIYIWLNYRYKLIQKATSIPWGYLYTQFGSQVGELRNFRTKVVRALEAVSIIYPEANYKITNRSLILMPSRTQLDRKNEQFQGGAVVQIGNW